MSRKLLLFGFEELPTILAAAAAAGPFGAEVVPVARQDYNKPWRCWRGWMMTPARYCRSTAALWVGGWWCCAAWRTRWTAFCRR